MRIDCPTPTFLGGQVYIILKKKKIKKFRIGHGPLGLALV